MPLIHVEALHKNYHNVRALNDVTLEIGSGITGLLGPNGAGKTTLIKILLGLIRATSGSGVLLGLKLGKDARAIRSRVGYMPEEDCYIEGLPGVEMVSFAARLSGLPPVEALRRSHEILDFCGMDQERYRQVETYSSGMRQKLKFALAIVHDPALLILDEPTASLDPEERQAMLHRLQILAEKAGKAILLSTHILPDVQQICDHVVILVQGQVRLVEAVEVLARPSTPAYHFQVLGEPQPLLERLTRDGYEHQIDGTGEVTVSNTDARFTDLIWRWARETGVGVRHLGPAVNSLEQVFLEAVKAGGHADS